MYVLHTLCMYYIRSQTTNELGCFVIEYSFNLRLLQSSFMEFVVNCSGVGVVLFVQYQIVRLN